MEINRTRYRILSSFILSLSYILICRACRKKSSCNMCDEFRLNWHTTATTGSPPVNTASSSLNARPGQVIVSSLVDQEVYATCTCDHAWVTLHLHVKPLYGARCQGTAACVMLLVPLFGSEMCWNSSERNTEMRTLWITPSLSAPYTDTKAIKNSQRTRRTQLWQSYQVNEQLSRPALNLAQVQN